MFIENQIPLAATFPLPFRVLVLVGFGVLGWATNLHGLQLLGVDGLGALELQTRNSHLPLRSPSTGEPSSTRSSTRSYVPLYRIFAGYTGWCFLAWLAFQATARSDTALVDIFRWIPAVCILCVVTALAWPYDVFHKRERDWFLYTVARCLFPSFNGPVYFSDIVFADILTSFAKVLGDLWLSLCMLLPGGSLLRLPPQDGWYQWILPGLMSLPYLIRLRQCLIEYNSPTNSSRRPLFNAIKYASSFPVIFFSAAQRIVISDLVQTRGSAATQPAWHGEHPLFRLWLMSAVINSSYSFWWDLTNDWGLDLLTSSSTKSREEPLRSSALSPRHSSAALSNGPHASSTSLDQTPPSFGATGRRGTYPYGLRAVLLYPLPVYPMAIFLNFILRMTWSIKLSSHLYAQAEGSTLIFWVEMAEVLRRWIWVFLRIEWEVVRRGRDKARVMSISSDDVELLRAHGKEDGYD